MKKIFLLLAIASIMAMTSCCTYYDMEIHETTPDATGNNDWTTQSIAFDEYGIYPSDFTLACKPASFLADEYDGALTLKTVSNDAEPVEKNMKVRATSIEGNAINLVFENFTITKNNVPTSLGTIVLKDIALIESGTERVKFETEQKIDTPLGPIAFHVNGNGKKDDLKMDLKLQETSGEPIEYTYKYPSGFEKDPKDPQFNGTLVSHFDMNNTGTVTVEIDGSQLPSSTEHVTIMATDGTHFNFSLKNFILKDEESPMAVGTVKLEDVELKELADGSIEMTYNKETQIIDGDDDVILDGQPVEFWLGPMLPLIPIELKGTLKDGVMDIDINIDMQDSIGQIIHVNFNTKQTN